MIQLSQSTTTVFPIHTNPLEWYPFSQGAQMMTGSVVRDMLKINDQVDMVSFAGGMPAPECFPTADLANAVQRVLTQRPEIALQYGSTEGYTPLRNLLAERMRSQDIYTHADQVIITSGSQQALDLLGKLFLDPDSLVAVEDPTYLGALQAWRPYRPNFLTLPTDDDGLDVAALANALEHGLRPRFVYVVSCFQNPTGTTLSPARKQALLDLATRYRMLIIEDDPYSELSYTGERSPLLAAMDCQRHDAMHTVVYLSTFSKLLAPGVRVGWIAAPPLLAQKIVQAKQGMDLNTGVFVQAMLHEACQDGLLERHMPILRQAYHVRRDAMLDALHRYMPAGTHWTKPDGGLFLWLTLPSHVDTSALLTTSLTRGVTFVPGTSFYANGGGTNMARLNFSHATPERIHEGVRRLAAALRESTPSTCA